MTDKRPGTLTVSIARDLTCTVVKKVAPWEAPIIKAQWGGQADIGDFEPGLHGKTPETDDVKRQFPDADEEYARLESVYGINPDTKRTFVEEVYGGGEAGVDRLDEAIAASWEAPKPREARKSRSSKLNAGEDADDKDKAPDKTLTLAGKK